MKILGSTVESSHCEELLGITIDSELTFDKLSALARIAKHLALDKRKIVLNSFITA